MPADRAGQRRGEPRVGVRVASHGPVQLDLVDRLDARQQVEVQQPGDAEPDLRLAMAVCVVVLDIHGGAVPHGALDHRGDLGGGAVDQLGVDGQRLLLHVPVDEHPSAAVARVPLGEQVLVVGTHVRGVGGDRGRALSPQVGAAGGEGGVRYLDGDGAGCLGGQVAAAHVAQFVLGVAVAAGGHGLDPGVRAVGVDDQEQALGQDLCREGAAAGDRGDRVQAAGAGRARRPREGLSGPASARPPSPSTSGSCARPRA
jgi:hypothetical protein